MRLCASCVRAHAVSLAIPRHLDLLFEPGLPMVQTVGPEASTGPNEVLRTVHSLCGL